MLSTCTEEDGDMMGIEPCYVQVVSFPNSHLWIWIGDRTASAPTLSLAMGQRGLARHVLSTNGESTFYVHSLYKSLILGLGPQYL